MGRLNIFVGNLQKDIKLFIFFNVLLSLFRVMMLVFFSGQLGNASMVDVFSALLLGARISLKTAGICTLIVAAFTTIPNLIFVNYGKQINCVRKSMTYLIVFILTLGFCAKLPYYAIYNENFNLMVFGMVRDDTMAIVKTAYQEYGLIYRLLAWVILSFVFCFIAKYILDTREYALQSCGILRSIAITLLLLLAIAVLFIFCRWGGAFTSANGISWENVSRFRNNLLDEAVLDEGQALYRAYVMDKRGKVHGQLQLRPEILVESISFLGRQPKDSLEATFLRTVPVKRMSIKPKNVVLIIGESYASGVFLSEYDQLQLVPYGKKILQSEKAVGSLNFLPAGRSTMLTIDSFLSGMMDTGQISLNHMPQAYSDQYASGVGKIMKDLGYKTYFWYGGYSSWDNIKKIVMAQSFDGYFDIADFGDVGNRKNAWGCDDEILFNNVYDFIKRENSDNYYFHVIMTTSNHPPFSVNLEGFPFDEVAKNLPSWIPERESVIRQLGHIWYADRVMGQFVEKVEEKKKDTLFVITGDHANRIEINRELSDQEKYFVPCIFYGQALQKEWFNNKNSGTHIQIGATLAELIGEAGHEYVSYAPSLLNEDSQGFVFNMELLVNSSNVTRQSELSGLTSISAAERLKMENRIRALKAITAWRILKGNRIN